MHCGRRRVGPAVAASSLRQDDGGEFGKACHGGDHADAGDGAARVRAVEKRFQGGPRLGETIVLPEGRPWRDDEDEARLEEVRREQQPAQGANDQPPV